MLIANFIRIVDRFHWLLLVFAAPLLLMPSASSSPVMLAVPVLWLLALAARRPALPATPLNAPLMLLMLMVLVSVIVTPDLAFSLPKVAGIVLGIGAFFAAAREARSPRGFRLTLLFFVAIGVGVAALGLAGINLSSTKIGFLVPVTTQLHDLLAARSGASFADLLGSANGFNANEVAGALLWVAPALVCTPVGLLSGRQPRATAQGATARELGQSLITVVQTLFLTVAAIFILAVLVLTQSRAAYLAIGLTALAFLFIILPRLGRWFLLALLVLALFGAGIYAYQVGPSQVVQRLGLSSSLANEAATTDTADSGNTVDTMDGRIQIWSRAIFGIQDFPFTGMGMNSFRRIVHVLYPMFSVTPEFDVAHAHNEFLQSALDLGLPGLIAFTAIYLVAFWMLWRTWRAYRGRGEQVNRQTSVRMRVMVLGLGGSLFAHMVYGMVDAVALGAKPGLLFWMLLGLICGLFIVATDEVHRDQQASSSSINA